MKRYNLLKTAVLINLFFLLASSIAVKAQSGFYKGMCDASAAVAFDENIFVVANDEDNSLHFFEKNKPEELPSLKLSEIFKGRIFDGEDLETDIEGAARLNDLIFLLGSHSTSKKGKFRPARHRLFAVRLARPTGGKFEAAPAGEIYTTLIEDLEKDPRFDAFKLKQAKTITPKSIGGLSIEGLAASPDGSLLIGFRNPLLGGSVQNNLLIGGKAFIVKLLNPIEVLSGASAKFDMPFVLDLDGFGIRSLEYNDAQKKFFIVAGPYHENEETTEHKREASRIYTWSGKHGGKPKLKKKIDLADFNAEALLFFPNDDKFVELLSDDGTICRENDKSFRALRRKF